ncbi:MAG: hypothetical protein U5K43_14535 [Halofilum sp. (in: g-proteobacteria)]|nr:hypothetical protein [Halofilum sp. (in: g-proteobacteria)]
MPRSALVALGLPRERGRAHDPPGRYRRARHRGHHPPRPAGGRAVTRGAVARPASRARWSPSVVAGFMIVALPLLIAVVGGAIYVDRLASRGERLVRDSVALAREGQALAAQLAQMERNARQYHVVGQPGLVGLYERHAELLDDPRYARPPGARPRGERASARGCGASPVACAPRCAPRSRGSEGLAAALERFEAMRALAGEITRAADQAIREELAALEARSAQAREFLFWQVVALVPVTLLLVALFSWLILRPIGRLARAIRSLGAMHARGRSPSAGHRRSAPWARSSSACAGGSSAPRPRRTASCGTCRTSSRPRWRPSARAPS